MFVTAKSKSTEARKWKMAQQITANVKCVFEKKTLLPKTKTTSVFYVYKYKCDSGCRTWVWCECLYDFFFTLAYTRYRMINELSSGQQLVAAATQSGLTMRFKQQLAVVAATGVYIAFDFATISRQCRIIKKSWTRIRYKICLLR